MNIKKDDKSCGPLYAVVAMGRGNEIGLNGDMPWHLPEDLRHFKELTLGHPVIMGRGTWMSLPRRPLPGRRNIVLSRDSSFADEGAETVSSLQEAFQLLKEDLPPFIIGGGQIYRLALPFVSRLYVTRVDADFPEADTFFPDFKEMQLIEKSELYMSKTGISYRFETYESRYSK